MTLGEKIRLTRLRKGMTQAQLCNNKITRNMLSAIENGKANPSLDTIAHIADRLGIPLSYILSENESQFTFEKQQGIKKIKEAFAEKRYEDCITLISALEDTDDELSLMLSYSYFELGKGFVISGSLLTGARMLEKSIEYSQKTIYDTEKILRTVPLYQALARNIQSPLLELDTRAAGEMFRFSEDYEFYKYMNLDASYQYQNKLFADHISAKEMMKHRDYYRAIELLSQVEAKKSTANYNAYAFFAIYADLEMCYKQIGNFEKAYRYSNKRLSMLEGFKS